MIDRPDFTGDPPDRWWSDMTGDELVADLAPILERYRPDAGEIAEAWTAVPQGPAFVLTTYGKTYRFVGDGNVTAIEDIT